MTDKSEKVDGYIPRHPKEGWLGSCIETVVVERDYETALDELLECRGSDEERRERIEEVKAEGWEIVAVRIVHASDPTAAEARQALISELLEWCHGQRNIDHDSLDAKLRELERVK